jgi:hypothetical protein
MWNLRIAIEEPATAHCERIGAGRMSESEQSYCKDRQ